MVDMLISEIVEWFKYRIHSNLPTVHLTFQNNLKLR